MDIGLKVNTTSVGWCCVTKGLDIVKKEKQLIGTNLFNEAATNEERRIFRSSRRMRERKLERIEFLTKQFEKKLNSKDPNFLMRLKESGLLEEDRKIKGNIFEDKKEEQEYFKKYPTIYHLRKHMVDEGDDDVRLLYLALLHMFKHRGNFLLKDVNAKSAMSFQKIYKELRLTVSELISLPKEQKIIEELEQIIRSKSSSKNKLSQIMELLGYSNKDKLHTTIFQLILGMKADIKNLFPQQLEWYENSTKICFSDCDNFEELKAPFEMYLEIEQIEILNVIKALYDWSKLDFILKGEKYISEAMIKSYQKHSKDLTLLKEILKYCSNLLGDNSFYKNMFQVKEFEDGKILANYNAYIGKARDIKRKRQVTCSCEEFYSYVKKILNEVLEKLSDSKEDDVIREKIYECLLDIDTLYFLPKQKTKDNFFIPNILLAEEMKSMLNTAVTKHPFLLETEENSQLSVMDALVEVFSFQIPYWIGTINGDDKYSWAVKKEEGKVYPWNIAQKIDLIKTRRKFMDNITKDCQFLFYEKVLPESSYFIRKMRSLDEINRIRIDGERLSVQAKQLIFNELFCKYDKVTQKGVINLLEANGFLEPNIEYEITGFTKKKLNQNMAPYVKALAVYPALDIETYEKIAEYITVCKGDRNLLKLSLESEVNLNEKILESLINVIRDSGWSEYSRKSIVEVMGCSFEEKIERSIIDQLYYSQNSLTEILGSTYNFMDKFKEINNEINISTKDILNGIPNPKIRRSFCQMVNVAKDLRNYLKKEPEYIYLNVYVPSDGSRGKTESKKAELTRLLKNAGEKELLKQLKTEKSLSLRKYLYYLQKGRCLYSGELIPYDELTKAGEISIYNVEHILPQSKIFDNSSNNLCLVKKEINENKGNTYPIDPEIQKEMLPLWNELYEENFISVKKYEALTSVIGIPTERKLESIDKLLMEHRKTAFKAAVLLNRIFKNSTVIFVSDTILNDYKKKFNYVYNERVNELGSAKDAYFVTICGKIWNSIFGTSPKNYIMNNPAYSLNVFNYDSKYWTATKEESKNKVASIINSAQIMQSVMAFSKESGSLYKMSLLSKEYMKNCKSEVAGRKGKYADTSKYGGYNTLTISHFSIIKADGIIKIEPIPLIVLHKLKTEQDYVNYFENKGMNDITIIKKRVLKKTVFLINGFKYYLASLNDNVMIMDSGLPYILSEEDEKYFSIVLRFNQQVKNGNTNNMLLENITTERNNCFFEHFLNNYQKNYHNRVNSGMEKLIEAKKNVFNELSLEKQCIILENLFSLVYRKKPIADLKLIGLSANTGKIAIGRNISKLESCIMIEESATGLYTKKTILK